MEMDEILHFFLHPLKEIDESALFSAIEDLAISPAQCDRVIKRFEDPNMSKPGPLECNPS